MLFPEEDAPLLKAWVVKRIENTSDADSEVLAEYIIALLKHDGDKKSIRELCEREIPDFLNEDAKSFLDDVFQAIAYRSYLPGAPPPPKLAAPSAAQPSDTLPDPDVNQSPNIPTGPRKRGYHDLDAPGGQGSYYNGPWPIKNARRSGNGHMRGGADQGRRGDHQSQATGRVPTFDPQNPNPMDALMAMGMPLPGASPQVPSPVSSRGGRQRRNRRCRDFDTKGFCSRGGTCPFDHGNGAASFVPLPNQQNQAYSSDDPIMAFQAMQNLMSQFPLNFNMMDNRQGRNRKGGRAGRKSGSRAPFSAEGPVSDRSKTTIVVESIPEENFNEEEVRGFFSQFGNVLEVTMQPYKRLAIVKYDKWGSANAAYKSHKAIFDNRFVKVFWYKDNEEASKHSGAKGTRDDGETGADDVELDADAEPEIDPEELRRKQEEAQEQFQEKEKKRADIQRQRDEIEQKQKDLMDKYRQATEELKSKLAEKNGGSSDAAPATSAEALRAKLADLESEAKMLGIDPDATDIPTTSFPPSRGGHGYGYRGRGGFAPRGRGFRGGSRGGLGGPDTRHAAYAQYSLDNRPKKVAITGVDFSIPEKDERLRHFLLGLGEFESVEPSPTTTFVSFQDRKTAERFQLLLNGKELPGIDGKLDIQWATGTFTSTKPQDKLAVSSDIGAIKDKEAPDLEDGEVGDDDSSRPARQEQEQNEMDYERPEDDDDAY